MERQKTRVSFCEFSYFSKSVGSPVGKKNQKHYFAHELSESGVKTTYSKFAMYIRIADELSICRGFCRIRLPNVSGIAGEIYKTLLLIRVKNH